MANATAGSAGNPLIMLYAGIGDPTQPQGMRLFPLRDFPLQDLDGPAREQLRQALLEDPVISKLLDNSGSDDAASAVSTEPSPANQAEIPLNNLETSPTTNGDKTQDRAETDTSREKNTKTNNAGKSPKNGRNRPRNGSKKASDTSRQPASPTGDAKPAKAKTPAKERNSSSQKSAKPRTKNRPNVDIRCTTDPPLKEQQNPTFSLDSPNNPYASDLQFTAPKQSSKKEWHCEKLGWFYNLLAQPMNPGKKVPLPCMKCAGCIRYELDLKARQYEYGEPAPVQTILEFKARNPNKARKFTGNREHSRRLPGARRISFLYQQHVSDDDENGARKGCQGVLIWDGIIPDRARIQMEQHARKHKMSYVKAYTVALTSSALEKLLPTRLRLPGQNINTCHFSRGWAKKRLPLRDWRDGHGQVLAVPEDGEPVTELWQPERSKDIAEAWRPLFKFEWDNDLTPAERAVIREGLMPHLHRARYVNLLDWLYSMSESALERTRDCINVILNGGKLNLTWWRQKTRAPKELVLETAAFLMGEREPEPALTLAAERLGFISIRGAWESRHIDPDFLAGLTDHIAPLMEVAGPRVPPHLIADQSTSNTVYGRLNAKYPQPATSDASHGDVELAAAA